MDKQDSRSEASKWISVEDRLPKEDKYNLSDEVLCLTSKFGRRGNLECYQLLSTENGIWYDKLDRKFEDNPDFWYVTHWMPLPQPPKTESE